MQFEFTKRKFLLIPKERQHQKCTELLRHLYEELGRGSFSLTWLDLYHDLCSWLQLPPLHSATLKIVADRYHFHLKQAQIQYKEHNLLPLIKIGDRREAEDIFPISIFLDEIRSAHNVGSILRTIEGFSLGTAYFSENTPLISSKQVKDAAMGATEWVKCHSNAVITDMQGPIIALETCISATSLYDFVFPDSFTLILGNEEYGCSDTSLKAADLFLEIPMRGRKNSLNVANAFACVASEICRQRQ